jgi:hypothetical protein
VGRDIPKPITLFFLYTRNRPVYSVSVVVVNRRIPQVISSKKKLLESRDAARPVTASRAQMVRARPPEFSLDPRN